jgi:hypothetical protein
MESIRPAAALAAEPEAVSIVLPKDGEAVPPFGCTFLVSARGAARVELSIDGGAWRPCRKAAGFWFLDWSAFGSGRHCVMARSVGSEGELGRSTLRRFLTRRV